MKTHSLQSMTGWTLGSSETRKKIRGVCLHAAKCYKGGCQSRLARPPGHDLF